MGSHFGGLACQNYSVLTGWPLTHKELPTTTSRMPGVKKGMYPMPDNLAIIKRKLKTDIASG